MITCWDNIYDIYFDGKHFHLNGKIVFYRENCLYCSNEFFAATRKTKFCCQRHSELNKPPKTEEHKNKISKSNIGKHFFNHSQETKLKLKKKHKGLHEGRLNNAWKGGVKKKNIPLYDTYAHQISYAEEVRRNKDDRNILEVKCAYCGKWYVSKINNIQYRIKALNGYKNGEARLYCSNECKKECPIFSKIKYSAEETNTKQYSREV